MLCPHCQAPNSDDARFCGACGQATLMTEPVSNPNLGEGPQLIGRVIAGRYRILAKIGEGGMGTVFQAEQISLKRTVAIKLLRPDVSASPMLLRRFNAEAEAVAKLRHPNTVNIYDFGQDADGTLFIAMELIEGRSLRTVIHHEAPLPIRRTLAIASQVAASLADAHGKTIIHRDLKPDNVMLTDRGRAKDNVTVLDFGIAKLRDDTRGTQHQMTQAGDMLGTPQYMAPEQIRGEPIDGRTDIYALGGMIYEMITARLPYEAPTIMALLSKHLLEQAPPPSQRRPDLGIPPAIDDLVMCAMAKDPAARPATMEDFGERIAAALAALPQEPGGQRSVQSGASQISHADTPAAYSAAAFGAPATPPPGPPSAHAGPSLAHASPAPPLPVPPSPLPVPPSPPPGPPPGFGPPPGPPPGFGSPGFGPPPGPPGFGPPGAAYAHAPPAYPGPPHAGPPTPHGSPYPHGPAPSGGGSKLMWALVAVLLLGAGGTGIYFATRGKGAPAVADARESDDPDPDKPDPDKPDPDKLDKPDPDKWDRKPDAAIDPDDDDDGDGDGDDADLSGIPGKVVDVGQGVKIVAPPGMAVNRQAGGLIIIGDPKKLAIIAGPIVDKSNDPDVLARSYARLTGLKLVKTERAQIAGARRKVYVLGGVLNGTTDNTRVIHIAVPLLGPGYRVAVVLHMPASKAQDAALLATGNEVFAGRIVVPSGSP